MKTAFVAFMLLFVSAPLPVVAETPYTLYAAGKYEDAVTAGSAQNDAAGLALAARAALASATTRDAPCLDCLKRAEDLARRATALDPKLPEAHIYVALALGYEARLVGMIAARLHNYPGHAKDEIDVALAIDPHNAWAQAALGGWNVEIVRQGGATLADWIYGAGIGKGLAAFAEATKSDPDNLAIQYQIALSLAGYDFDRFHSEVEGALTRVIGENPVTAYERLTVVRAGELLDLLKRDARTDFDARVRKYQGYP